MVSAMPSRFNAHLRAARRARCGLRLAYPQCGGAAARLYASGLYAAQSDGKRAQSRRTRFSRRCHGPLDFDLVSLFRHGFISWEEALERVWIGYYYTRARSKGLPVDANFESFYRALEWMGLQRHLKILGLFAQLHYRDGKSHYLTDTPRFIAYAQRTAQRYSELAPLARLLDECVAPHSAAMAASPTRIAP